MGGVTRILQSVERGDPRAAERLLEAVYRELRALAAARLRHEAPGQTLQATALVHEAYLRLVGDANADWQNRAHFFAAAAEAMRRILIERARSKARLKRGGDRRRVEMPEVAVLPPSLDLLALDEALQRLEAEDPAKAELVKLRFFAGLEITEAAQVLGISRATADRHWAYARAWLFVEVKKGET
ncbi:MAG: ECF-type sigma factor [Planctomycetota bacterium]|jgi:RNA polymerase sigma factor (TIGR02999 family)